MLGYNLLQPKLFEQIIVWHLCCYSLRLFLDIPRKCGFADAAIEARSHRAV